MAEGKELREREEGRSWCMVFICMWVNVLEGEGRMRVEGCSGSAANSTPKPSPHSPFLFPAIPPPPLEEIYREGRQRQVHFSTNWVSQDMPHPIGLNWCESLWCLPWVLQQRSVCRDNDINLVHVAERSGPHQPTDSNANLQTQAREGEGGQTLVSNGWAFCLLLNRPQHSLADRIGLDRKYQLALLIIKY